VNWHYRYTVLLLLIGVAGRFIDRFSTADRSVGYGLVRSIYVFVAASGSVVTGLLADAWGWQVAYGLLVLVAAGIILSLVANRVLDAGL